jgi:hypothetical protein
VERRHENACKHLFGKTERKMPLRRPDVDRKKNNIKMDLKLGGRALTDVMWSRSGYGVGFI